MFRNMMLVGLTVAAICLLNLNARPSTAAPISQQNPYRSFNVTGVNYGSMRWEQTHRGQASATRHAWTPRRGGFFFRRR